MTEPLMPSSWRLAPIGSLGSIVGGGTPSTSDTRYWHDGTIPWVSPKDMKCLEISDAQDHITPLAVEESSTRLVRSGSVLLVIRSGILQHTLPVGIATREVALNQDMKAIQLPEELDPRFIAYGLIANQTTILNECCKTGTTVQSIEMPQLKRFQLPIAPSAEQARIADRIDELFTDLAAGVAALERVKRNLSRYRAAVLHAAVTGRLTEAWRKEHGPPHEPAPKLLERILVERRKQWERRTLAAYEAKGKQPPKNWKSRYKEAASPKLPEDGTTLPDLPKGWCWASVDQCVIEPLSNGISVKGSDTPPGTPALKLNAMGEAGFDYSAIRYIPINDDVVDANAVSEGDFFVSRGNGSLHLLARGTLAQTPPFVVVFPDTMIRLRICEQASWIPTVWASGVVRHQIAKMAKTTAGIHKISQSDLARLAIPLPPMAEQAAIVEAVNEKLSQIDALEAEVTRGLARASRLRQAILKAAFEGKLVPQDPSDEPASVLLERIRKQSADAPKPKRQTRKKTTRKAATR